MTMGICLAGMFLRTIQDITVDGGRRSARAMGLGPPNRSTISRELSIPHNVRTKRTMSSALCATPAQTPVRDLRILNPMSDTSDNGPGPAAQELKRLREKAGIGLREMARLVGMGVGTYRHYEERLKEDHLPPSIYVKVKPILMARGITLEELRVLLHEVLRDELEGVHTRLSEIEDLIRGGKPKKGN